MPGWIDDNKEGIQFVVWMLVGVILIVVGIVDETQPGLIALGAGAIGLPGFQAATRERKKDEE